MPVTLRDHRYTWWELAKDADGWRLQPNPVPVEHFDAVSLSAYVKWFYVVSRRFVVAAEMDEFSLRYVHPIDGLLPGRVPQGVVSAQERMVTNLGRAHAPGSTQFDEPVWIGVEEAAFRRWLNSPKFSADDEAEGEKRPPAIGHLRRAAQAAAELAKEDDFPVTSEWLWDIVSTEQPSVSRNLFDTEIWKKLQNAPRQKGPPSQEKRRARDSARERALARFRAAFIGNSE
ncbi:hypothetical protein H9Q09_21075 [Aurantimonas sp. DM33-3]|uniref:hypothetical protein n=1 Tax=Aurantimonas sp. DM33-3 TaxID=2766955 RepID=UPI001652B039|nr:hypothetical protein [Aurantimonas sp. DM33-3]MBC6718679.1 hypothetical protein [Aurantimonas sp. DM33-3]